MSITETSAFRFPYQGDAATREKINAGAIEYQDMHLSHAGTLVRYGYMGKLDFAVIEVTKIREDGSLVYSSSCGGNNVYLEHGREVHPRGEHLAGRAARGDARRLLDGLAARRAHPDPDHPRRRQAGHALPEDRREQGGRGRRDELPRPQRALQGAGGGAQEDRAAHPRLPRRRGEGGPPARSPSPRCSRASATSRTPCSSASTRGRSRT